MHELGVVIEVVKAVEGIARERGLSRVDTIVLRIGELSSMVPRNIEECFPAAVDGGALEGTKLRIEVVPGNARCRACGKVFGVVREKGLCPACGSRGWELLSGKEFTIKEIVAC